MYDKETHNYYLRARYYSPETHRFISVDTYEGELKNPLTMNQNIYCLNNPLIYVDPSGHSILDIIAGWAFATDDNWFGGLAQHLTGHSASASMGNEDFSNGYTAGKITNKIYAVYSLGSSAKNIKDIGGTLTTSAGGLVTEAGVIAKEESLHLGVQIHAMLSQKNASGAGTGNDAYSSWNKGSFNSAKESLEYHYKKHGNEVNANSLEQYQRKAEGFKQNLRGASKSKVEGAVEGTVRYVKNGKYIDISPDGTIVSFGKR